MLGTVPYLLNIIRPHANCWAVAQGSLRPCRELERTSTSARSAPAKDVARAAEGGDSVGRQSSNGAAAPSEGLKARIQGLVQSLRAVTEVRMRRSSQPCLRARVQGLVQSLRAVTELRMRHSSQAPA